MANEKPQGEAIEVEVVDEGTPPRGADSHGNVRSGFGKRAVAGFTGAGLAVGLAAGVGIGELPMEEMRERIMMSMTQ